MFCARKRAKARCGGAPGTQDGSRGDYGDLAEEFSFRIQSSGSCWSWYWGKRVVLSSDVWSAAREGRWIRIFSVALGAYIAAGLLEFGADAALLHAVHPESLWQPVLGLIMALMTFSAPGWIRAATYPPATIVDRPMNALAFLIAGPLASLAGGALIPQSAR